MPSLYRGRLEADLDSIEERDAESTFRIGDDLIAVRDALPSDKFAEWQRERRKYSRSYVADLTRLAVTLAPYRERLVRARAQRSVLVELGSRPDMAETVLWFAENGVRPSVSEVRSMLADNRRVPTVPVTSGGEKGVLQLMDAKRAHARDLVRRIGSIAGRIEEALVPPKVGKAALYEKTFGDARWARAELYNLCAFIRPAEWDTTKPVPVPFEKDSGWAKLAKVLYDLGGIEQWPSAVSLRPWLEQTALPLLRWAADDEPLPDTASELMGSSEPYEIDASDPQNLLQPHAAAGLPADVQLQTSEARIHGVYEIRAIDEPQWCRANLTAEGWVSLDGRRYPRLAASILVRIDDEYLTMSAQAVSAFRRSLQDEDEEKRENHLRLSAYAFAVALSGSRSVDVDRPAPVLVQHRIASEIYDRSYSVPPLVPVGNPDVVLIPEYAQTDGATAVNGNLGRIVAHVTAWVAAMVANSRMPESQAAL